MEFDDSWADGLKEPEAIAVCPGEASERGFAARAYMEWRCGEIPWQDPFFLHSTGRTYMSRATCGTDMTTIWNRVCSVSTCVSLGAEIISMLPFMKSSTKSRKSIADNTDLINGEDYFKQQVLGRPHLVGHERFFQVLREMPGTNGTGYGDAVGDITHSCASTSPLPSKLQALGQRRAWSHLPLRHHVRRVATNLYSTLSFNRKQMARERNIILKEIYAKLPSITHGHHADQPPGAPQMYVDGGRARG